MSLVFEGICFLWLYSEGSERVSLHELMRFGLSLVDQIV